MPYLKSSHVTGLSPKRVDVTGFTQSTTEDLEGTYSQHEVLLADAFNVTDNVTISDNLILAKLSDDGNAITVTGNATTTRTIAGSGSLEGSTFAQTPNASLTSMTGILGSGVTFPTGHILQVIHGTSKVKTTVATASNVYTSIPLSASITPSSTTSKILITVVVHTGSYGGAEGISGRLYKNGSNIADAMGVGSGSRQQAWFHSGEHAGGQAQHGAPASYLDSPATTSALTYQVYCSTYSASYPVSINATQDDQDSFYSRRTISSITLMEVAG